MKRTASRPERDTSRRSVILGGRAAVWSALAGCGSRVSSEPDENTTDSSTQQPLDQTVQTVDERDTVSDAVDEIESIFESLAILPVAENDEFIFSVSTFDGAFDSQRLIERTENIKERLQSDRRNRRTSSEIEYLVDIAELARLLVIQRIFVHQVIASCWTSERRFEQDQYEGSIEALEYGLDYLDRLTENGNRVEDKLEEIEGKSSPVNNLNWQTRRNTQNVLIEFTLWAKPSYTGLYHGVRGLKSQNRSLRSIREENYDAAAARIDNSNVEFQKAKQAFGTAHGRGRRIPQVDYSVDNMRCSIPGFRKVSSSIDEWLHEARSGNETAAREHLRSELQKAEEISYRDVHDL